MFRLTKHFFHALHKNKLTTHNVFILGFFVVLVMVIAALAVLAGVAVFSW